MPRLNRALPLLAFSALAFASSCSVKPPSSAKNCTCPTDIMCTMDYRSVSLRINDASGNPATLDRYETVRMRDGFVLQPRDSSMAMQRGAYIIASDGHLKDISTCGETFEFRGYRGRKVVVREPFTLRNDCCHIQRQSGKTATTL